MHKSKSPCLDKIYLVEVRDSLVNPKNLGLPHSYPLVFPKVTHGISLGPPKIDILQIWENAILTFQLPSYFPNSVI